MKRLNKVNVNTVEYLNKTYSDPEWASGYKDAYKRLDSVIRLISSTEMHLDIGCADGYLTESLMSKFPESYGFGVDISDKAIEMADKRTKGTFIVSDCYDLPFINNYFDLIHMGEILEHLENPKEAVKEAVRTLKKGGCLIVTVPTDGGGNDQEHLWEWTADKFKQLFGKLEIIKEDGKFFNGKILLLICKKK